MAEHVSKPDYSNFTDLARVVKLVGDHFAPKPDLERIANAARRFVFGFDEFSADPAVMGFELECLEAAIDGRPAPRDEDPPR